MSTNGSPPATFDHDSDDLPVSTISEHLTITGNVTARGQLKLDGQVHGDVQCAALVLGESSHLEGNVVAEDVVVGGRLIGLVRALRVTLRSNGHVEGDLFHQSLAMEEGAHFEGKSCCSPDPLPQEADRAAPRLELVNEYPAPEREHRYPAQEGEHRPLAFRRSLTETA